VSSPARQTARVRARFLGNALNLRAFEGGKPLAVHPLTIEVGERGVAVLFRFGAVALVNVSALEEASFFASIAPFVVEPVARPEEEEVEIDVHPAAEAERVEETGRLTLRSLDLPRLRLAAHIVAKSTVLAWYEQRTTELFDRIEALAEELRRGGSGRRGRELAREIGDLLLAQARTVGRAEVAEKPELTWDDPELDRLYERLALEYELRERDRALSRKLDIASRTVETYLDLIQTRQGLRVEWYIVILIVVEIALGVYEMAR
jgi:required for meiotic nuclear division protein 1